MRRINAGSLLIGKSLRSAAVLTLIGMTLIEGVAAGSSGHRRKHGWAPPGALSLTGLPSSVPTEQDPAGSISGTVFSDQGYPLLGATVTAIRRDRPGTEQTRARAFTNANGEFRIASLTAGEYQVYATAEGYLNEHAQAPDMPSRDRRYLHAGETVAFTLKKGGVITGKVFTEDGEPVIEAPVVAESYRDRFGRILRGRTSYGVARAETDDRGIYRIYGLPEGSYLIKAGTDVRFSSGRSTYDEYAPFYYPSARRASAIEVPVQLGQEVTGIDIRYRAVHGFSISGVVSNGHSNRPEAPPSVTLFDSASGTAAGFAYASWAEDGYRFTFEGIPSGEYDLIAEQRESSADAGGQSAPLHLTVADRDTSGLTLQMVSLASAIGQVVVEQPIPEIAAGCIEQRPGRLSDVFITAVPERAEQWPSDLGFPSAHADPDGQFVIRRLPAGRYYFAAWLPQPSWYLKSITAPGTTKQRASINAGHDGLKVKSGEKVSGIVLTIGVGAVSLRGRVLAPAGGAPAPENLLVIAVPEEPEAADDVLRFVEMRVRNGSYSSFHFGPGRYRLIVRKVSETRESGSEIPLLIWKSKEREELRRQANEVGVPIEVRPCENTSAPDITLGSFKDK